MRHEGPLLGTLLALALAAGCSSNENLGGTNVGKQELYRIDNVKYDEFFEDVFEFQKQAAKAREEEKKAREPLALALGSEPSTVEALAAQAGERAKKMALGKPKIVLGFEGMEANGAPILGKAIAVTPPLDKRKPWPKEARDFAAALEETLRAEAKVADKHGAVASKARRRLELSDKLRDSISENLPSASDETKKRLELELEAAKVALGKVAGECEAASAQATKFLRLSAEGITAASEAKPEPPPKPAAKPAPKPAKGRR
jgi:hypothetical protein